MTGVRIHPETKRRLEYLAGRDYSIDDVIRILLERTIPDEKKMSEGQTKIGYFDKLFGKRRQEQYRYKERTGGAKVSYVCQECGTQYGDSSLEAIPIICSECVDQDLDEDQDGIEE